MTTPKQWRQAEAAVKKQQAARGIVESDHYLEWTRGDILNVTGEAGVFTFLSVRLDPEGEPVHANVYGGPKDQEMHRSFRLDRLTPFKKIVRRRSKKASTPSE